MGTDYEWSGASVSFPDWKGTFQIDQRLTRPYDLYKSAGVDPAQWTIIGFDWGAGETGVHTMHAIVVPKGTDLTGDEIQATDLALHYVDPFKFILEMVHSADFRMRSRELERKTIRITALGDVPEDIDG